MIRHLSTTTIGALLVLTACGADATTTKPPPTAPPETTTVPPSLPFELPADPDAVVLQIDIGVNQPDPIAIASGYPYFTLYADGRLIARDRDVEAGALAPLVAARLDGDGVRQLVGLAIERGALDPLDSYGYVNIADGDGTSFVVTTADRSTRFGVYGLGAEGSDRDELTPAEGAARSELSRLREELADWPTLVADHIVEQPTLYTGDTVLLVAEDELTAAAALPGVDVAGGAFHAARIVDLYCVELSVADQLGLVESITASARYDGRRTFRQLLPHEPGCALVSEL